jgi:hypothetical protein
MCVELIFALTVKMRDFSEGECCKRPPEDETD